MARRSQSSSQGDNPLDPNYLPPHYKEYYRIAIDRLAEEGPESYSGFLTDEGLPDFLCDSEISHITNHLKKPHCVPSDDGPDQMYSSELDADGSSGTYWPMHSDGAVPELDLGWPMNYGFQGTEVTTLIHPPAPDNPSIKEEARRMIRSAQQVVALVMDIFTDVDLFSDILDAAARRIPVYILLDHMNSHLFMEMAAKCRVNLNFAEFLRVRTVEGSTYFCRTGMSFKGQMMEKFLLVDCNVVLSGSYSFMWSFEKIHRSIAHIFQGELVSSFDEEFRVLFAQSEPLVPTESALLKMDNPYAMAPYGVQRPFYQRKLHMMFPRDDSSLNSLPNYTERVDLDRHYLQSFRRDVTDSKKMGLQIELDQSRAFLRSRQMEMDALKRHSFAEGTYENYSASKQYSRQMFVSNNDDFKFQSSHFQKDQFYQAERHLGPSRPQGLFEKIRAGRQGFPELEEYGNNPRYPQEPPTIEPNYSQEGYPMRLDYVHSGSSREVLLGSDKVNLGLDGRLGQKTQRRQNVGQKYICQTSPTQKQNLEQKQFFQEQEVDKKPQENKQGLRNWRINSYMSAYQPDEGDDGLPMPIEPDYDDDALVPPEYAVPTTETLAKYNVGDTALYKASGALMPLSETLAKYSIDPIPPFRPTGMFNTSALEAERAKEFAVVEKDDVSTSLAKQDSFRSRINPLIQRSSRLRSSLIFSSSKVEQHNSTAGKVQHFQSEETASQVTSETEAGKMSSKVAQILEKYKTVSKDTEGTSVSQGAAMTKFQEQESQDTQIRSMESMQYKTIESSILDSKQSFSRTLLDAQYSMSSVSSNFEDLLNKGTNVANVSSKVEKMASQLYVTESSKPALTEKNKPSLLEKIESLTSVSEPEDTPKQSSLEIKKPPSRPNSALIFENPFESLSKNSEPLRYMSKTEEDKSEPPAMEFLRRGSLKLKQLLNQTVDNKAEESSFSDNDKLEKQALSYKCHSKGDIQEPIAMIDDDEKLQKPASSPPAAAATPVPKSSQSPQNRFPSSASNVIYSSNLRDDTKVILEQISANSQKNRAEMAKQAQQAASTGSEEEKSKLSSSTSSLDKQVEEDPPTEDSLSRTDSFRSRSRFMRPTPTSTEERDTILKKMDNMRKEKRVYSRFEVFCKKDESPNNGESDGEGDNKDKKISKFMPKLLGSFKYKK